MDKISTFINHEGILPVSIIVPLQEKRKNFFTYFTLPLLRESDTKQIIINIGEGNAAKKRNEAFLKATQPFICFCDDDKLLPTNYIKTLYDELSTNPQIDFVYTGYTGIVLHPETHPVKTNYKIHTRNFDVNALKQNNFIDTTSLMRRSAFPGFDETLAQHDDWDLYLNMAARGSKGKAIHGIEFFSFYLDEGITSVNNKDCSEIIRKRYGNF